MFKNFTKLTLSLALLGAMAIPAFAGKPNFGGFGGGNRGGQSGQSSFRGNMGNMNSNKFQAAQRHTNMSSNINKNVGRFNPMANKFNQGINQSNLGIKNSNMLNRNTGIAGNIKNNQKIQPRTSLNNLNKNSGIINKNFVNKNIGSKINNIAKSGKNQGFNLNKVVNKIGHANGIHNLAKKIGPGFNKGNHHHHNHHDHGHANFWWNSYCNHHHCSSSWDPCYTYHAPICTPCDVIVSYPVYTPVQVPVVVPVEQHPIVDASTTQPVVQVAAQEPIAQPMADMPPMDEIAGPVAQPAASPADLSIEDIKVLDVGDPSKNLGPMFRVTMKNNGSAPAEKFGLGLFASLNDRPGDNMVSGGVEIEGLAGGDTQEFDVRMPLDALSIKADTNANGEVFKFLFAVADPANTVQESEKKNNIKGMARDAIQKLDVAAAQ